MEQRQKSGIYDEENVQGGIGERAKRRDYAHQALCSMPIGPTARREDHPDKVGI